MIPASGGGVYSYRQLEQLWTAAGGSAKLAPLMAAIAMAESGGNARAKNPKSDASGLWQINGLPFPGDVWDPLTNARMAVAKYKSQGLKAWATYTSGAYKKFLQGKAPDPGVRGGAGFVDEVKKFLGTPYVWGGDKPTGFDCSGLVQYALEKIGIKNVPRTSEQQWRWVKHIPRSELKPGDLVFYAGSDGTAASPGHVAVYAGGNQIIQAPQTGEDVEQVAMPPGAVGYGRVPGIAGADFTGSSGGGTQQAVLTSYNPPSWVGIIPGGDALWTLFGDIGHATGLLAPLEDIANTVKTFEQGVAWFFVPSHWVRLFAGAFGGGLVLMGIVTMTRTGRGYSVQNPLAGASYQGASVPSTIPAPGGQLAPAVGIAEVTIGAILLFVAFHNLPVSVEDFGGLISYLQAELQNQGAA